MLSDGDEVLLGAKAAGKRPKAAGKLGMAAEASDDEDMFADICVDDLDEEQAAEPPAASPEPAVSAGGEAPPAEPADGATAEEEHPAAEEPPAAAAARPPRPPLHPGKPTAVAPAPGQAAALAAPASDMPSEGGQDSCSGCTEAGEERPRVDETQSALEQEKPQEQQQQGDEGASLSEEPAAPVALPVGPAEELASEEEAPVEEPVAAEEQAAPQPATVLPAGELMGAEVPAAEEVQEIEVEAAAELPALPVVPLAAAPAAVQQAAPAAAPAPAAAALLARPPPNLPAAVAPLPTIQAVPSLAALPKQLPAVKPAAVQAIRKLPAAPAPAPAKTAAPAAAPKPAAAPAPKFGLPGSSSGAVPPASGLPSLLSKPSMLGAGGFRVSSSRLGMQPPGSATTPAAKPPAPAATAFGLAPASGLARPGAAAGPSRAAGQQGQRVPRQPLAPAMNLAQPEAPLAGTPISALPRSMHAAAAQKVLTPAPFTPGGDPVPAGPAAHKQASPPPAGRHQQQQGQQQSPHLPAPAALADDILAADFGPPAVLEGHEACMEASLELCGPIGDAVQEQKLALDQLTLEAEALRRQVNALRVDLTIYRSSLAFMDSPMQAHAFESAKRRADGLLAPLAAFQPPSFELPSFELPAVPEEGPVPGDSWTSGEQEAGEGQAAGGDASLLKPRALEHAFNEQPLPAPEEATPLPGEAADREPAVGAAPEKAAPLPQEMEMGEAEAAVGAAMEMEGVSVSVTLSPGQDGVVLSLAGL